MKRFLKIIVCLFFVLVTVQYAQADEYRVLVLPDNIEFDRTNYYIYPDSSVMFASDTINYIKKEGRVKTVSMNEIRDALRSNVKLTLLTKNALKEFKYNYNIPFVDFKSIAKYFNTDKVLIITSTTDVQSHFMQRTIWDFLNIPGAAVTEPAYKISTYVALIDVEKEEVIWQNTFYKKITEWENRMIATGFAPATGQLEKIKYYSMYYLCPQIAHTVQAKILPPPALLETQLEIQSKGPEPTSPDMNELNKKAPSKIEKNKPIKDTIILDI